MQVFHALETGEFTIEEIDAITGPAIGRPKSATFRTLDIAGVDVFAHVVRNLAERLEDESDRAMFVVPRLVEQMLARGWTAQKSRPGFYQKRADGRNPRRSIRRAGVSPAADAAAAGCSTPPGRLQTSASASRRLLEGTDKVGRFLRRRWLPHSTTPAYRTAGRLLAGRRRSRHAVGLRLGARSVELRNQAGPAPGPLLRAARRNAASFGTTPAPASWISATACCASSSTRR